MHTLEYITKKYNLNANQKRQPVEIPNTTREDLAKLFCELGFKTGVEIGVEAGLYSEMLCQNNPGLKLYCVDAWTPYKGYRDHVTKDKLDALYEETKQRLAPYDAELVRKFSVDAAKDFQNNSLDFVYIDANHEFMHVAEDMYWWTQKVKPGGIVAGHDYMKRRGTRYIMHVVDAVHGFINAYSIRPLFTLGTKEYREGERRERPRSWFFVKT